MTIYERAASGYAEFEGTCGNFNEAECQERFKGARKANKKKVEKVVLQLGIVDKNWLKLWNPYEHWVTKTHIIYVHSAVDHFIKVDG